MGHMERPTWVLVARITLVLVMVLGIPLAIIWTILIPLAQTGQPPDWTGFGAALWTGTGVNVGLPRSIHFSLAQPSKTLWDWLGLIVVPLVIAVVGWRFTQQQGQTERKIAAENQYEAALETYLDRMSELLLDPHELQQHPQFKVIAQSRTVTTLRRLDGSHNASVLRFLRESGLLGAGGRTVVIDLSGADLSGADLSGTDLSGLNLAYTNLEGAVLSGAYLAEANLERAILRQARLDDANFFRAKLIHADTRESNLQRANLNETILTNANLQGANLRGAMLVGANLKQANLSWAILDGANVFNAVLDDAAPPYRHLMENTSLKGTIMPDGSRQRRWRL